MTSLPSDKPAAVVLGLGQNGLATVRALGRRGVSVIGIDRDLQQFTARSRYCRKIPCPDFRKGNGVVKTLLELGPRLPRRGVLFPSGDHSLHMVSEERERLREFYRFTFPTREVVRLTLNKERFYRFAERRGIPIPSTYFPESEEDCRVISREIRYPCILKPVQPNLGWRTLFPDNKLFEASDADDFLAACHRILPYHRDVVVQERIPGGDDRLYFSLTYFDAASRPLCMFTGRKLRQYPPRFGTSSMAQSLWDPRIADMTVRVLTEMHYTGYGSVEFKWDQRDRAFKVIEVSARTWFPHGIASACGMNIEYLAYCDAGGLKRPEMNGFRSPVKWIHEERDLKSALDYLKSGDLTIFRWLSSYRGRRAYAVAAWDDPLPAFSMGLKWIAAPWRRITRKAAVLWPKAQEIAAG